MPDIKAVYEQYANIDIGDLSSNQKDAMREVLRAMQPEELKSMREHEMFVELLQKFRMSNVKDMERVGDNFLKTLHSLLAVGEDGVYSNSHRFIYELIQNVDDCEYENVDNCHLDIQFKYHTSPGEIVLTYNEEGFTPKNVFDITGIAEKSKNISADKVEIGEKGIGFKSVFGIADKVHIESGLFSFELCRDSFTVPVPRYEGFAPVKGTRLTLEMPTATVEKVYRSMVEQYMKSDAALNENPILFLNKLTHLKMYFDGFRYIEFDVERKNPEMIGDIAFEDDVVISVDMKDHYDGMDKGYSSIISCKRYTQPIIYGEKECKARYGDDASFSERRHNLIAIFPNQTSELKDFKGLLYSFLPTQIQMTAPIVLHVPFKLDGSREFVDPQGKNQWFNYTVKNLAEFLKNIYIHLAGVVKQDIIYYIPNHRDYFFNWRTNAKIQCLQLNNLSGEAICSERIFFTTDGTFENIENIVSFAKDEKIENPVQVFSLLGETNKLFIPSRAIDMQKYDVRVISNVPVLLFKSGLEDESKFNDIANLLDTMGKELKYVDLIKECSPLRLTKSQLLVINSHRKIYTALNDYASQCLLDKKLPGITFDNNLPDAGEELRNEIKELITSAELDQNYEAYLERINYKFILLDGIKQEFAIAGQNAIILADGLEMGSFGLLTTKYDPRRVFTAALQIRQASERLNEADESMTDAEYLKLLRSVRRSLKDAFGAKMYNSYIQIINQAGMDKNRFLNELIQNADDCKYPEGAEPTFNLRVNGDIITVSYNELGFTKQNVRAITAIGESTKKLLLDGRDNSIGEKGVGFKSVFGVAESVDIHSNDFDFRLTDKMPTVPEKCEPLESGRKFGTTLVFKMKADVRSALREDKILRLCLCLRNLKQINIQGVRVHIFDSENARIITIGDRTYHFEKFAYDFTVTDTEAIEERSVNQRAVSKEQSIYYYLPKDYKTEKYSLYVGLPTIVECNIPIIIDAPFELTTSRDNIIQCRWNELVREAIYDALFELMMQKRDELRIDVFKYVKFDTQGGASSCQTFSEPYLNYFDWADAIKDAELMPLLNANEFVSVDSEQCLVVPDVIAFISREIDISDYYDGVIIDTYHKSQYISLLESLGCERSPVVDDLACIQDAASNLIEDEKFRKALYDYLTQQATQANLREGRLYDRVKELPIFPIRDRSGARYVSFSKNIYTHESKKSDDEFLILETKIMEYETLQKIIGWTERVNEWSQEVYEARYQNNIVAYIEDEDRSDKEKAIYILNEYKNNFANFQRCQFTLKGMLGEIPMEMISGNYQLGNKFINEKGLIFSGTTIKEFIVSDSFEELAEYLGCTDVLDIHYDDIDLELTSISDEDIEDFQDKFTYYAEILGGFIEDDIISEEQIEEFNLEYLIVHDDENDDDEDEDFPGSEVINIHRLREHIRDQFKTNPNPYVEVQRIEREPKYHVDKEAYTSAMYASEYNPQKCFCQMCRRIVPKIYIERNDVQRLPKYAWEQMYLSLCLNCSKDYILLRKNKSVWEDFIRNILNEDIDDEENIEVDIGNKTLTFTATHLAEIQTILELEQEEEEDNDE